MIGLVKYCHLYGLSSGEAAALVLARRAMRLSERLPGSLTALVGVNPAKHVWSQCAQLHRKLAGNKATLLFWHLSLGIRGQA